VQLLGHVQVGSLEDALGDPEGDPVDEQALPELERCRRGDVEPREIGEIATEGLPALCLLLDLRSSPAPQRHMTSRDQEDCCIHEQADPEGDEEHVAPARSERLEALNAGPQH